MSVQNELRWTTPGRRIMVDEKRVTWVLRDTEAGSYIFEVRGRQDSGFVCTIPTVEESEYIFQSGGRFKTAERFFVEYQVVKDSKNPRCLRALEQLGGQSIMEVSLCQVLTVLTQEIKSDGGADILTTRDGTANRFFLLVGGKPVLVSLVRGQWYWSMYFMWQNLGLLTLLPGDRIFRCVRT